LIPNTKIFCYEPTTNAIKLLHANISLNCLGKNIQIINKAISNAKREITAEGEKITTIPFADVVTELKHIHLLKMDIEGIEFDIILNASYDILSNIDFITMELHTSYESKKYFLIVKYLEEAGFYVKSSFHKLAVGYLYAVRSEIMATDKLNQ